MNWNNISIPHGKHGDNGQIQTHPESGILQQHVAESTTKNQYDKNDYDYSYSMHSLLLALRSFGSNLITIAYQYDNLL